MFLQQDPIEIIERELRLLIHDVLSHKFGENWIDDPKISLKEEHLKSIKEKIEADKSAQGNQAIYDLPLSYADFSDLRELLIKHDNLFKPVFDKWKKTMVYLEITEGLRNTIKHHRDINSTQEYLLIGIAGEITDSINFWRIGTKAHVKQFVFTFSDYVSTEKKRMQKY